MEIQSSIYCHTVCTVESMRKFLWAGADINARNNDGATPLHAAASYLSGRLHDLLNAGADVIVQDNHGRTPLHLAILDGNMVLFKRLLKICVQKELNYMTQTNSTLTLVEAAALRDCTSILRLLEAWGQRATGTDVEEDGYRRTPALNIAVAYHRTTPAKYPISRGANPFHLDLYGRSAVVWPALDQSGDIR
ncbi:ankyrin repeat-containing domain protein [Aspergillus granulosus]|uniref:Ankyrin repeat-containing domain protein n=1 Tax=Aspergillus granulosus TaxID=176169 RepID=A0ABR4H1W5_9EURO